MKLMFSSSYHMLLYYQELYSFNILALVVSLLLHDHCAGRPNYQSKFHAPNHRFWLWKSEYIGVCEIINIIIYKIYS